MKCFSCDGVIDNQEANQPQVSLIRAASPRGPTWPHEVLAYACPHCGTLLALLPEQKP